MMERMDMIVEEVLRRLKLLLERKRILLILRDHSDFRKMMILVRQLKGEGYSFSLLSFLIRDVYILEMPEFAAMDRVSSGIFREEDYEHFLSGFEGMLVSDLGLLEMKGFSELRFQETLGKLVFQCIRRDRPVYALSRDMTGVRNTHLAERMSEIREELRKLRIHVILEELNEETESEGIKEKSPRPTIEKEAPTNDQEDEILTGRFITLADAVSALHERDQSGHLRISSSSRLTMEAEDYLRRQGIEIRRV